MFIFFEFRIICQVDLMLLRNVWVNWKKTSRITSGGGGGVMGTSGEFSSSGFIIPDLKRISS